VADKARKEGKADEAAKLDATLPTLQKEWQLARDRFDIAIRQRKASQEALKGLEVRVARDQDLLDRLEGKTQVAAAPPAPSPAAKPAPSEPVAPATALPGMPNTAAPTATSAPATAAPVTQSPDDDPIVRKARRKVDALRAEQKEAEDTARASKSRIRAMEQSMRSAEKLLAIEQDSIAQIEKAVAHLTDLLNNHPPTDPAEKKTQEERLADAQKRLAESRERAQRIAERIATMNETLKELQETYAHDSQDADEKRQTADAADAELAALMSPFTRRNITRWANKHGPNLLAIIGGMIGVHFLVRQSGRHIVRLAARNGNRGSPEDRENRASTLVGVFRYAAGIAVFGGGLVMLLDEVGVPIVPLMGGAAVIGLAVAFGAQNLIRDYFSGFMMLTEDQFSVNDVVKVGNVSGVVERITLRVIVLRDLEGVRHFIPHGTVTSVSNLTHGWSRALFDVPVSYSEDIDQVIGVLRDLARDLKADPVFGRQILEEPDMLGVNALTDSKVVIRFLLKTRPLQQWSIRREMLLRIKKRFEELGIALHAGATPPAASKRIGEGPISAFLGTPPKSEVAA